MFDIQTVIFVLHNRLCLESRIWLTGSTSTCAFHLDATIAQIIQRFVEARTARPVGTVTRSDATTFARIAGATEPCLQTLDEILALGERAAFAPRHGENAQELREKAMKLLGELDSLAWQRKTESFLGDLKP